MSSLRKDKTGQITQVQVNGGIHPGNSGGPVVDANGQVVGVAVSIITGTQVNFAIPGEAVHSLLRGRPGMIRVGQSKQVNKKIEVPVTVRTIDPLNQIKGVEVQWWMGKPGAKLAKSNRQPFRRSEDSSRTTVKTSYSDGKGEAKLTLPELEPGKIIHMQAVILHADGRNPPPAK